jgi:precorrin-2 dehydrogenase / sirohydrochlorin ferrochelatase
MFESNKENISMNDLEYTFIALLSNKINVLVVGGGRAGYIKAKTFAIRGCNVKVVSKDFTDDFKSIEYMENLSLIRDIYKTEYIADRHIVVIATSDEELNNIIKQECEGQFKIYLCANDFKQGLFVTPVQNRTDNIEFAVTTRSGSPKTSVFLSKILKDELIKYDNFAAYAAYIRKSIKDTKLKCGVMDFINTNDFNYFFKLGKEKLVLKMFYGDDKFEF